jgi:Ca-activated chloride channel family protein
MVVAILLTCLLSTTWAAPGSFETRAKLTEIPAEISANSLPLEDFLSVLSQQSGLNIVAAPEVAGLTVDLHITERQTLDEILAALSKNYQLDFRFNEKRNAIIVFKSPYYSDRYLAFAPGVMYKTAVAEHYQAGIAPAPKGNYAPSTSFNTEEYQRIYDNSFQEAFSSPVSTFSIDVDTASYSNVRRFINSGTLPPPDAMRTEEMLNYFTYEYPQPTGEHPFAVTSEVSACPWHPEHQLVMIGLQGKNIKAEELPPGNLVFLIDVSGSMAEPNKLPLLKTAFKMLVRQLREQDTVSIVVYAGKAGVVLEPTSGSDKAKILSAIDSLQAGGSTAGGEGIRMAYRIAKENYRKNGNNRVILATDGDFNVGVSSEGDLTRLVEEKRKDGIFLSVIGVGEGNLKDSKMMLLADKGNGNYSYIDNAQEAKRVMVGQLAGTLFTIAKDVKLQVEFNPAKVKYYRLIGYEKRVLDRQDFNDDQKDAGDMGAGQSVTALYEVIPAGSAENAGVADPLSYQRSEVVPSDDLLHVKIRYKRPEEDKSILFDQRVSAGGGTGLPSENFRFAAAVAEYGMLLRDSEFKGQASYRQALDLAESARGKDAEGYRSEFIRMVRLSQLFDER